MSYEEGKKSDKEFTINASVPPKPLKAKQSAEPAPKPKGKGKEK